jgi:hypothetical protein
MSLRTFRAPAPNYYNLVLISASLFVCTIVLKLHAVAPSRVSLGREESDDIYEGEWNLQRGEQADFPGVNPDNPDGPSWMIGMHRDGESTPGSWANKNQVPRVLPILV